MKSHGLGIATLSAALALAAVPAIARTNCTQNSISGDWLLTLTSTLGTPDAMRSGADDIEAASSRFTPIEIFYCETTIARSGAATGVCYNPADDVGFELNGQIGVTQGCLITGGIGDDDENMAVLSGRFSSSPGSWPTLVTGVAMQPNEGSDIGMDIMSVDGFRMPWNLDLGFPELR